MKQIIKYWSWIGLSCATLILGVYVFWELRQTEDYRDYWQIGLPLTLVVMLTLFIKGIWTVTDEEIKVK